MITSAQVIVVGNLKGGTGKSTVAVNLACALRGDGKRVALLDADPQGTAADWISRGGLPVWSVHLPVTVLAETERWLQMLSRMRGEHDIVVVDLPAVVAPVLAVGFLYANLILIPVAPNAIELMGTKRVLRYIASARAERPYTPPKVLIVPTRVYGTQTDEGSIAAALGALGEPVGPPLHLRAEHDQAFARGEWVGAAFPGSEAHRDFLAVADRAMELLLKSGPATVRANETAPMPTDQPVRAERDEPTETARPRRPLLPPVTAEVAMPWWRRLLGSRT